MARGIIAFLGAGLASLAEYRSVWGSFLILDQVISRAARRNDMVESLITGARKFIGHADRL